MANEPEVSTTIDVRTIPPRLRHPMIFERFDSLVPGQAMLLVNDHDPKPLYYQFHAESSGGFTWDYLRKGPEVWAVRIGKPGDAARTVEDSCCSQ